MHDAALPAAAGALCGGPISLLPLSVQGLTLVRDGRKLIDGIDLRLGGAGVAVVMGPNGAGKSVLLRLLHGLTRPSAGTVRWGGRPLAPEITRRQALVFQKPVLLRRSVAANVDFALRARTRPDPASRDALLARVGLSGQSRQPARLLSGGEQQRLALARALATRPEVLFLDEPTASLDPASAQMIEAIVRDCARDGMCIVFVTHDIGQARRIADEVIFLAHGRLAEHRPAHAFFDAPRSEAARAFLAGRLVL